MFRSKTLNWGVRMGVRFLWNKNKTGVKKGVELSESIKNLEERIEKEAIPKIKEHFKELTSPFVKEKNTESKEHDKIIDILNNPEFKPAGSKKDNEEGRFLYQIVNPYKDKNDSFKFDGELNIVIPLAWIHINYAYNIKEPTRIKEEIKFLYKIASKNFNGFEITNFPTIKLENTEFPISYDRFYDKFSRISAEELNKYDNLWINFGSKKDKNEIWGSASLMKTRKNEMVINIELSIKEQSKEYI